MTFSNYYDLIRSMGRINNTNSANLKSPISFFVILFGACTNVFNSGLRLSNFIGMQEGWRYASTRESISKPILLALITALVIGVIAPLVIPHATHPSMIYHIILHIAGLTIAIFLSIVSFLAYSRNTTTRMLLMAIGFTTLALVEFFYLLQAGGIAVEQVIIPTVNIELSHVILLLMVSLFGLGILKVSK
jgi:uncharacterized membrane protein YeaQ/YmgE (transglycosylase-associated protein family)